MGALADTFSELLLERVVSQLQDYRRYVQRVANGGALTEAEAADVVKALRHLELPAYSLRRDVAGLKSMRAAMSDYRRRELALLHPHLWTDAREWAELRLADRARRRKLLDQLRAFNANGHRPGRVAGG